jgi:hypothetical protein
MTTYSLDESQGTLDRTVRLLDSFYDTEPIINANEYELVHSFFMSVAENPIVAKNYTSFLFKISANVGKPVLELVDELRGVSSLEMTSTIIYYLNLYKSKHSLYGISVIPQPVPVVQRNILN